MRNCLLCMVLLVISVDVFAQQEAQFSHYMYSYMGINPGYAGSNNSICATALMRQQWVGFTDPDGNKGAPQTYLFTIESNLNPIHGGLGLGIIQDKLGFEKTLGVKLAYAYRQYIGSGNLGVGLGLSILDKSIDFSKFNPIDDDDPALISKAKESNMALDLSFGAFYTVPNQWYAGISSSQMLEPEVSFSTDLASPKLKRHYYLMGGYNYVIPSMPDFELLPSVLIKSDGAATQYDLTALLRYNNKFWGGVSYRTVDALVFFVGANYKNINFGYSYDFTTSTLGRQGRSSGSHEIMVNYCFEIKIPKEYKSPRNPRFL